jgi:fatty-acyl-CoA synthase
MFHANAWGMPYAAWLAGADLILPGRFMQAEPLSRLIAGERVTCSCAVPTIWAELLRYSETNEVDFSSVRQIACGGAAVPRALMEAFRDRFGIRMLQAWGMTETSPVASFSRPPKGVEPDGDEEMRWRALTGRVLPGVELRIVDDDGTVLPWDGEAVGEVQVRGPWITASYYGDPAPEKFDDGWLRTGDIASVTSNGYMKITDRSKDVIKSGGEWISSVELEGLLMAHPEVAEAAVIAVPDPKWTERPLACVVLKDGATVTIEQLRDFLAEHVARWQVPERWSIIAEVPKTSVGKFDKKVLRAEYADGALQVDELR